MKKDKTPKQLERHFKGVANHYRIEILLLLARRKNLTLEDIINIVGANKKTLSEHTRRLVQAGLINKKYRGNFVEHNLSPYGQTLVTFIKTFQKL